MDTEDSAPDDQSSSACGSDAQGSRSSSCRTSPTSTARRCAPETTMLAKPPARVLFLSEGSAADKGFRQMPAKRYKRPAAAAATAAAVTAKVGNVSAPVAVGSSSKQVSASPMRRRILRKDRRQTLEMLTSDDDVNEYVAGRPSTYIEPASRRNLHEVTPHMKSSFETLYNPEFNHLLDDPELFGSDVSSSCGSLDAEKSQTTSSAVANSSEAWHLLSGPKVSSPYLDVTSASDRPMRSQVGQLPNAKTLASSSDAADNFDEREDPKRKKIDLSVVQQDTSGDMWTEFGGHERFKASDRDDGYVRAVKSPRSSSQPLNVTIKVSKPSERNSSSPTVSRGGIGVDLKIELGKQAGSPAVPTTTTADGLSTQLHQDKLPVQRLLLPDKAPSPRKLTSPETAELRAKLATNGGSSVVAGSPRVTSATAEKPRERRVLPAVPDSADLEVSDLLRESVTPAAADRPKSAVEILVAKGRSSSILQGDARGPGQQQRQPSSMVSQQLRSLFHNPSPQIMLHRAATRTPQAAPARPESVEFLHQQQANRYLPLRGSHNRGEDTWRGGTAVDEAEVSEQRTPSNNWRLDGPGTVQGPTQIAQARGAEQPPEPPLRRNTSLLPSQRSQQQPQLQPPPPRRPQSAVPPPPPVPPRQAKTTIARQQSPSTFYPNKVLHGPGHCGSGSGGGGNSSIDHMHKKLRMPASQSLQHNIAVEKSPEPGGSEYPLASDAAADVPTTAGQLLAPTPQIPTRIQTNPRAGARARDSFTREAESPNFALMDPTMDRALDFSSSSPAPKEVNRSPTLTSTATVGQGRLLAESQRDELRHRPVSRRDQDSRAGPAVAASVHETPGYQVGLHSSDLRSQQLSQTVGSHQARSERHGQTVSGHMQSGRALASPVATSTARSRLFGDRALSASHQTGSGQLETQATIPDRLLGDHSRSASHRQTGSGQLEAQATVPDRLLGDHSRSGSHRQTGSGQLEAQATIPDRMLENHTRSGSHRQTGSGESPQPPSMAKTTVRDRQLADQKLSWSHGQAATGQPPVVSVTVRDRLFGDQARQGIHRNATASQAPVATSHDRRQLGDREKSEGSHRQTTRAQLEAPATVAQPPVVDRNPASRRPAPVVTVALPNGKAVRMPPNAVRVLPNAGNGELLQAMRSLGGRSARSPRPAPDDAVTDLERLCRGMRLDDADLLDGADRRDTSARLKTRLDALSASKVAGPVGPEGYTRGGAYSLRQEVPQRPQQRQQAQSRGAAALMLQPGERETGPEVIL